VDQPNNVELWRQFVEYQEESVPVLLGAMTGKTKSVINEIVEKKQAILEKALLKNGSSLDLQLMQVDAMIRQTLNG
jgi:hypothetical protein